MITTFIFNNESLIMFEMKSSKLRGLTLRLQFVLSLNPFQDVVMALVNLLEAALILSLCWKLLNYSNPVKLYNTVFYLCLEGDDNGTTEVVIVYEQPLCDVKCLDS